VSEAKEILKIQKGGLYIEILDDDKFLENITLAKDYLAFLETRIKEKSREEH